MREAKVLQIVEGTNQIQRMVIGRSLTRAARDRAVSAGTSGRPAARPDLAGAHTARHPLAKLGADGA